MSEAQAETKEADEKKRPSLAEIRVLLDKMVGDPSKTQIPKKQASNRQKKNLNFDI